jgi:VanZ family protein
VPSFGLWDPVVEKGAHILGYSLLALATWYAINFDMSRGWLVLLFAVLYAITDEFHQSFVPGRHSSWVDILIFDGGGAALMVLAVSKVRKRMR